MASQGLGRVDGLERRAAGRGDVLDDRHVQARADRPLDEFAGAVPLGLLPDEEALQLAVQGV